MSGLTSGSITVPGLGNGTDFTSVVDGLKNIELIYSKKLARWHADWETRLIAFQELRTGMVQLNKSLKDINSINKFMAMDATSSNSNVATATASVDASAGSYKVEVKQLARASSMTLKQQFNAKTDVVNSSGVAQSFSYMYNGTSYNVPVPDGTTLDGLRNLINTSSTNPGTKATLVSSGGKYMLQLQSTKMGTNANLGITENNFLNTADDWRATNSTEHAVAGSAIANQLSTVSAAGGNFDFTLNGTTHSLAIPAGCNVLAFNSILQAADPSLSAHWRGGTLQIAANNQNGGPAVFLPSGTTTVAELSGTIAPGVPFTEYFNTNGIENPLVDQVNPTGQPVNFTYTVAGGATQTIVIPPHATWESLRAQLDAGDSRASFQIGADGKQHLVITPNRFTNAGHTGVYSAMPVLPSGLTPAGFGDPAQWDIYEGQNAMYKINNFPSNPDHWLESADNTLYDAVDGVVIGLKDTGVAHITVAANAAKMLENIEAFVDAVNLVRKQFVELTKVDTSKTQEKPEYAKNQNQMQMGSILTGNYGVQLMSSQLKQGVAEKGLGFSYVDSLTGLGDIYASLSHVGIKTNAKDGDAMFGLLEIDKTVLKEAIKNEPQKVAELFSVKNKGVTHSTQFSFHNALDTAEAGEHDVNYTVDAFGNVTGTIAGGTTSWNAVEKLLTVMDGPAKGVAIQINDLTPGAVSDKLYIKEGKIVSLEKQLDDMLSSNPDDKGALFILEDNYKLIMKNIANKIDKEADRIELWEKREKAKYARLEATLARYDALQKTVDSQVAQMSASKKK